MRNLDRSVHGRIVVSSDMKLAESLCNCVSDIRLKFCCEYESSRAACVEGRFSMFCDCGAAISSDSPKCSTSEDIFELTRACQVV